MTRRHPPNPMPARHSSRCRRAAARPLRPARSGGLTRPRPAFTLVELIVVIIILSVAAAMIAPRLVRRDQRRGERIVQHCVELLRAATTRASITADAIAIEYDKDAGLLRVLTPLRPEGFTQTWAQRLRWRPDPLIPPVNLETLEIDQFLVDSRRSRDGWAILGPAGAASISLTLRPRDAAKESSTWRIIADTSTATVQLQSDSSADPSIIDLDAAGLRDTPW